MTEGVKNDKEKDRWDLLPIVELEFVVKAITCGAKKYAADNWKKLEGAMERYYSAAMRHIAAWKKGELIDKESGLPHLAHAICSLFFVFWHSNNSKTKVEKRTLVYLATPYTDPSEEVMEQRYNAVNKAAGYLMEKGYAVYSPISQTHIIAKECSLPKNWEYWKSVDEQFLSHCDMVMVVMSDGYSKSVGVKEELLMAKKLGIPVKFFDQKALEIRGWESTPTHFRSTIFRDSLTDT